MAERPGGPSPDGDSPESGRPVPDEWRRANPELGEEVQKQEPRERPLEEASQAAEHEHRVSRLKKAREALHRVFSGKPEEFPEEPRPKTAAEEAREAEVAVRVKQAARAQLQIDHLKSLHKTTPLEDRESFINRVIERGAADGTFQRDAEGLHVTGVVGSYELAKALSKARDDLRVARIQHDIQAEGPLPGVHPDSDPGLVMHDRLESQGPWRQKREEKRHQHELASQRHEAEVQEVDRLQGMAEELSDGSDFETRRRNLDGIAAQAERDGFIVVFPDGRVEGTKRMGSRRLAKVLERTRSEIQHEEEAWKVHEQAEAARRKVEEHPARVQEIFEESPLGVLGIIEPQEGLTETDARLWREKQEAAARAQHPSEAQGKQQTAAPDSPPPDDPDAPQPKVHKASKAPGRLKRLKQRIDEAAEKRLGARWDRREVVDSGPIDPLSSVIASGLNGGTLTPMRGVRMRPPEAPVGPLEPPVTELKWPEYAKRLPDAAEGGDVGAQAQVSSGGTESGRPGWSVPQRPSGARETGEVVWPPVRGTQERTGQEVSQTLSARAREDIQFLRDEVKSLRGVPDLGDRLQAYEKLERLVRKRELNNVWRQRGERDPDNSIYRLHVELWEAIQATLREIPNPQYPSGDSAASAAARPIEAGAGIIESDQNTPSLLSGDARRQLIEVREKVEKARNIKDPNKSYNALVGIDSMLAADEYSEIGTGWQRRGKLDPNDPVFQLNDSLRRLMDEKLKMAVAQEKAKRAQAERESEAQAPQSPPGRVGRESPSADVKLEGLKGTLYDILSNTEFTPQDRGREVAILLNKMADQNRIERNQTNKTIYFSMGGNMSPLAETIRQNQSIGNIEMPSGIELVASDKLVAGKKKKK